MNEEVTVSNNTLADITPDRLAQMGFVPRFKPILPMPLVLPVVKKRRGSPLGNPKSADTLRNSQLRALAVLTQCEATNGASAITLSEMSQVGKVSEQSLKQGLGATRPEKRELHDTTQGYHSLITRGLVVVTETESDIRYYLSMMGQRKTEDIENELKRISEKPPSSAGLDKRTGPKVKIQKVKGPPKQPKKRIKTDTVTDPTPEPE